jgi:hypothetical protein
MQVISGLRSTITVAVFTIAVACSSGDGRTPVEPDPPAPPPPPLSVRQTVGVAGGTVADPEGRVSLTIPAGALGADVAITIDETTSPPTGAVPGAFFEFGPSGTQFALPVTMTVRYNQARLPSGLREDSLRLARRTSSGTWEFNASTADTAQNRITGEIRSFSSHGVACCWGLPQPSIQAIYRPDRVIDVVVGPGPTGVQIPNIRVEWARSGPVPFNNGLPLPDYSSFQRLVTIPTAAGTYPHPAGPNADVYWYRARYEVGTTLGPVTTPAVRVVILPSPAPPPSVDSIWVTNVTSNGADVHFLPIQGNQSTSVDGYRIRRRLTTQGQYTVAADLPQAPSLPFRDQGLLADTVYEYRVDAYNQAAEITGRAVQIRTLPGTSSCAVRLTTPPLNVVVGTHWGTGLIVTRRGLTGRLQIRIVEDSGSSAFQAIAINPNPIPASDSVAGAVFQARSNLVFGTSRFVVTAEEVGIGSCHQRYYVTVGAPSITIFNHSAQQAHLVVSAEQRGAATLVQPGAFRSVLHTFAAGHSITFQAYDTASPNALLATVACRYPQFMPSGGQFTVDYLGPNNMACRLGW